MRTSSRAFAISDRPSRQAGFTLLELLVVLALVAVLAALVLPAYNRTLKTSKVSQDLNNLRQLGVAVNLHVNDCGYIPGEQWPAALAPKYLTNWNAFKSPFDQRSANTIMPVSYDVNVNLWGKDFLGILSPADCILLAPLTADKSTLQFASTSIQPSVPSPLCRESNGSASKGGTAMDGKFIPVLFGDLHGELLPIAIFHSSKPNPDPSNAVSDLRWNE